MSEYCITGAKAKEALRIPGVQLEDDWGDGSYNVMVEEDEEDFFVEWCEMNEVDAKLI